MPEIWRGATVETTFTDVSDELFELLTGMSRGALLEELRKRDELFSILDKPAKQFVAPEIASVRWSYPRPTDPLPPVYAVGSFGWAMEQAERMQSPYVREHNRKIAQENAALMDRYARLWGFKKP